MAQPEDSALAFAHGLEVSTSLCHLRQVNLLLTEGGCGGGSKRFPRGEMETPPGRGGVEGVWRSVFGMAQPEDSPFPHGLEASSFHTSLQCRAGRFFTAKPLPHEAQGCPSPRGLPWG